MLGSLNFIFINGRYRSELSSPGVLLDCMHYDETGFTLHLPKGFSETTPIHFQHKTDVSSSDEHVYSQVLVADENANAVVIQSYSGDDSQTYSNRAETRLILKSNARINFYKWQQESENAAHEAKLVAEQSRNSCLGTYHVAQGGQSYQDQFLYLLEGEHATCESIGFYQTDQKQHFKIDSHIQHLSSHTNSRQLYKGIANGQSHVGFNGMVMVDPEIKDVCAHQRNNNLLLSSKAQVDTKPELEIYSEDVRCSHGATVGQLDEEALFYLRSRGMDSLTAQTLLTRGFSNEIFDEFPDVGIAKILRGGL